MGGGGGYKNRAYNIDMCWVGGALIIISFLTNIQIFMHVFFHAVGKLQNKVDELRL
jgi:hypothetical protein